MTALRDTRTTYAERRTAAAQRSAPQLRTINTDDVVILRKLDDIRREHGARASWVTPQTLGGEGHSQHANILVKLERHGLVERQWFDTNGRTMAQSRDKGGRPTPRRLRSLRSRITAKGRRVLAAVDAVE